MDQTTLVSARVEEGRRVVHRLVEQGLPIQGAAWLLEPEYGWWLYIATPLVTEDGGTSDAYMRVNEVIRGMPDPPSTVYLRFVVVSPSSRVGKAVVELWDSYPKLPPVWHGGFLHNGMTTENAYIYPPPDRLSAAQ